MSSFEINIDGYTYQLGYLNPIPGFIKNEMQDLEYRLQGLSWDWTYTLIDAPVPIGRRYKHLKFQLQIKVI